jgi:predicted RNase H-like HicB family nuclease
MKLQIRKENDGEYHVASCLNLPGCYVQANSEPELMGRLQHALNIYKKDCDKRNQPLPDEPDRPVLNVKLRFTEISSEQLIKILLRYNYHIDHIDDFSVLMSNSDFPFNRIHLPQASRLSPLLINKIFGKENTIHVRKNDLQIKTSVM